MLFSYFLAHCNVFFQPLSPATPYNRLITVNTSISYASSNDMMFKVMHSFISRYDGEKRLLDDEMPVTQSETLEENSQERIGSLIQVCCSV